MLTKDCDDALTMTNIVSGCCLWRKVKMMALPCPPLNMPRDKKKKSHLGINSGEGSMALYHSNSVSGGK